MQWRELLYLFIIIKKQKREHLYMSKVSIYLSLCRRNGNKAFYI
ncbi:hypothetical protein BACCELL_01530 [Bacteroides cellulosilyticus DSM 14838]|uniref:Uncharacterized protein n=1 Tax=Bacteroides cellulosilyticus DSM 14838 TaxID=537012 RepID=E2NB73_9BACE|nr:hypothetical protein BACCELL_01530 [Bacteroides cellulosilyticus DSM 14838]